MTISLFSLRDAMHTGVISFCDRISFNIKSSDTKDDLLDELARLYHIQILQRHWHKLDTEGIQHMYRSPHLACLRSNGNPYYMFFTLYEDVPIVYYIDKKIQPGYQKPRVILGKGKWHPSLFTNTLLDGEMVKDKYGKWVFLINDMIVWKGEHLEKKTLPQRLEYAYDLLESHYTPDKIMDVCRYYVKRYAHATQQGVESLQEYSKELPYTSRGIYFWPFFQRFKPKLYNFDDSLIKAVTRKVKDTPEFRTSPDDTPTTVDITTPSIAPLEVPKDSEQVLWLRKTEHPDVYDIYPTNHGMVQNNKIGIANVPSLQVSKFLRAIFKDTTVAVYVPFHCAFDSTFQKWTPIRRADQQ